MQNYPITLRPLPAEEGGGFLAEVPDLPGCTGDGDTQQAAIADAENAIAEWIDTATRIGRPVPEPQALDQFSGKWLQRVPRSLHMELTNRAQAEGVSLNALVSTFIAEGLGKRQATG